jgi:uncharacterized protein GlcG (DUF336 family)
MRAPLWIGVLAGIALAFPVGADEKTFITYRSLTPEVALDVAKATVEACRNDNFQIAVAVVDRGGNVQVLLRDRFAGAHTPESARRKAFTAVSFRTDTGELAETTQAGKEASGIRHHPEVLMMGGGLVIWSRGEVVGGIGVSGAPGGRADEDCAKKGLATIRDKLDL